jgi:phosphoglycerate dehydrogenase-like enzyme
VVEIVMFAPHLAGYAGWLEQQVAAPVRVRVTPSFREEDLLPLLPAAEIVVTSHWSARLGAAAHRLRFIQVPGAGWDKLDPAGVPPGVLVANCYEHEQAIAEWVLMMCLALSRELLAADRTIRMGVWRYFPAAGHPLYPELGGRTIGLVGLGRIGRAVCRLAGAFGMRRIGVDARPVPADAAAAAGLAWAGGPDALDRLLAEADFVVLAVPYDAATKGMIDAARLRRMKPTASLINPARAELCDERALYEALRDRVIAGAALDPWWRYPVGDEVVAPSAYPYAELDNVIMTPHASGSTRETMDRRMEVVAANIDRFLRGEPVVNVVAALSRA